MKLVINQFYKGQTSSPYTTDGAFWKSANLDIHGLNGMARINYKPTGVAGSAGNIMEGIITSFARLQGVGGSVVFADNNNDVKRWDGSSISDIGSAALNAYYVAVWKGYVLATTATGIQACAISAGMNGAWSSALTPDSGSITNTTLHKILVSSKDGKAYFCNGQYVGRLEETFGDTFDPSDAASYSLTADALALPTGYVAQSLEDFGRFVAVFATIAGQNRTLIMLWDTESTEKVDAIYEIGEIKMTSTLEHEGNIFITGGNAGNIYVLSESGLKKYAQIIIDDPDNGKNVYAGGLLSYTTLSFTTMAWWKDKLMVAVSTASGVTPSGVYSVKNGVVNHEFIASNGITTNANKFGSMITFSEGVSEANELLFGVYYDTASSVYTLEVVKDTNNRLPSGCYLETPLLRAGYKMQKGSVDRIEVILARPLQTGESFTLSYKRYTGDTYVTLATKSYTTDGAQTTFVLPGIKNIENLQFKIELATGASSKNTPMLTEISLF